MEGWNLSGSLAIKGLETLNPAVPNKEGNVPRIETLGLGNTEHGKYLTGQTKGCSCCADFYSTWDGPNLEKAKDLVADWIDQLTRQLDDARELQLELERTKPEEWYKEPEE
jgi:hypothetical protein